MSKPRPLFVGASMRGASLIVDLVIVVALMIAGAIAEGAVFGSTQGYFWVAVALYFIALPATPWQGTAGKRTNKIRIATTAGERIGLGRSALRFAASLVSWATLGLGFMVCMWNAKRRTLHDYIAGTVVVDAKAEAAEIASASPPPVSWTKRIGGSVAVVLAVAVPFVFFYEGMNARVAYEGNARNFNAVTPILKALDDHRAKHGRYPATLAEVAPRPRELHQRTALYYAVSETGEQCWLAIVYWLRPGFLPSDDVREYDCAAKKWQVKDFNEMKARREGGY